MNGPADPIALGLPHREPFIFIEKVVELVPGESARATKSFPASTDFFRGHFPGVPVVPGVILSEACAQTAGLAVGQAGRRLRLAAIKAMKFPAAAGPDELLEFSAKKSGNTGGLWLFEVEARVAERIVAQGTLVLAEEL